MSPRPGATAMRPAPATSTRWCHQSSARKRAERPSRGRASESCSQKRGSTIGIDRSNSCAVNNWRRRSVMRSASWSTRTCWTFSAFTRASSSATLRVWSSRFWRASGVSGGAPSAGFGPSWLSRSRASARRGSTWAMAAASASRSAGPSCGRRSARLPRDGARASPPPGRAPPWATSAGPRAVARGGRRRRPGRRQVQDDRDGERDEQGGALVEIEGGVAAGAR